MAALPVMPTAQPRVWWPEAAVSALVHRRGGLLDDPRFAQEITSAARLAIEHERLHASRRVQLQRLRLSRARLVATADTQRRQLERDLHDGAQQRLLTLSIAVGWRGDNSAAATRRSSASSPPQRASSGSPWPSSASWRTASPMVLSNEGLQGGARGARRANAPAREWRAA